MGKSLFEVWGQTKNVKNKGRGDVGVCVFFFIILIMRSKMERIIQSRQHLLTNLRNIVGSYKYKYITLKLRKLN